MMAIALVAFSDMPINLVGVFATGAVGALSWSHAKSFRELSQSYGVIEQELGLLEDRVADTMTEEKLTELVLEVERTISREHTMWLARRLMT